MSLPPATATSIERGHFFLRGRKPCALNAFVIPPDVLPVGLTLRQNVRTRLHFDEQRGSLVNVSQVPPDLAYAVLVRRPLPRSAVFTCRCRDCHITYRDGFADASIDVYRDDLPRKPGSPFGRGRAIDRCGEMGARRAEPQTNGQRRHGDNDVDTIAIVSNRAIDCQ